MLVVDDDPAARDLLTKTLAGWGMRVAIAPSGAEALRMACDAGDEGLPFALVLMEWKTSDLDGIEDARRIHAEARAQNPAVVIVTAHGRNEVLQAAKRAGVAGFLVKPFDTPALYDTINNVLATPQPAPTPVRAATKIPTELAGARILVAEDNDINQQILGELLTAAGVEVEFAANGRIAVEKTLAAPDRFDIVLMDLQMPEMDGLEATRLIRARIDSATLPILAMTAHAMERERTLSIEAGMDDHLTKPIDPDLMFHALVRWIKPREGPRAGAAASVPVAPPLAGEDDALPRALPPFDVAAALKRVNGNGPLLRRLILRFAAEYATAASDLGHLSAAGHVAEAERLAHSLGGVARQLGAADVAAAAREIEDALRGGSTAAPAGSIERLAHALAVAAAAAATLDRPPDPSAAHAVAEPLAAQNGTRPTTVLVVDDEPTNVAILRALLERDYRVAVAASGEAALDLVAQAKPDLVLLDALLPGIDGFEVCARLKAQPANAAIPVVFMTGLDHAEDAARARAAGAVDYVTKPFDPRRIRACVREHIASVLAP